MVQAKLGDTVRIHYTGTLDDGSVFDSSEGKEPLEFTLGEGSVIPGFENAVVGMNIGDSETVRIEPEEAYGEYDEELIFEIEPDDLPPELEPQIGMVLQVSSEEGIVTSVVIKEIDDDCITIDANHPLAGCTLNFKISLVGVL